MNGYCTITQDVSDGTPLGSVKMAICPAVTGHRTQLSGKHHAEQWRHEYRGKQEDTVWMELLGEYVRVPTRQEDTIIR